MYAARENGLDTKVIRSIRNVSVLPGPHRFGCCGWHAVVGGGNGGRGRRPGAPRAHSARTTTPHAESSAYTETRSPLHQSRHRLHGTKAVRSVCRQGRPRISTTVGLRRRFRIVVRRAPISRVNKHRGRIGTLWPW